MKLNEEHILLTYLVIKLCTKCILPYPVILHVLYKIELSGFLSHDW